ncbi:hypothetical protein HPB48_017822 [Haemaphysalis longicornis]|uniref:HAT C-terminal dimerisation domain-containing protein n=1 Tax=Haemaphysalis longicornis TaxID=44386 RepID=A0A9J6GAK0_HAELO|nr:hypothetical protein HPB48_017822 [Haemaphysalis longicornis]
MEQNHPPGLESNIVHAVVLCVKFTSIRTACGENPCAELAGFAMSMLVLPYSNAEVEMRFSQLNIVKSKIRNKPKPETTNSIFVVRAGLK